MPLFWKPKNSAEAQDLASRRLKKTKRKAHKLQAFNMQDIADACNISRTTLYRYCKNNGINPRSLSLKELVDLIIDLRIKKSRKNLRAN